MVVNNGGSHFRPDAYIFTVARAAMINHARLAAVLAVPADLLVKEFLNPHFLI